MDEVECCREQAPRTMQRFEHGCSYVAEPRDDAQGCASVARRLHGWRRWIVSGTNNRGQDARSDRARATQLSRMPGATAAPQIIHIRPCRTRSRSNAPFYLLVRRPAAVVTPSPYRNHGRRVSAWASPPCRSMSWRTSSISVSSSSGSISPAPTSSPIKSVPVMASKTMARVGG